MKFSVLVPAYKSLYLAKCIESVLVQTYEDWELIVVNDASPYDLDSVLNQYHDDRIHYYKNETGFGAENVVGNWNKCLSFAKGEFVICMGDDDCLLPNCLIDYYQCQKSNPNYDVYHIRTEIINENSEVIDIQEARPEHESVYSMLWHRLCKGRMQFIGDFMFKTSLLREKGGFWNLPYASHSDDITTYIMAERYGIYNINKLGFQYRVNAQTITNTQNLRLTAVSTVKATDWMNNFLKNNTSSFEDSFLCTLSLKKIPVYRKNLVSYCIREDIKKNYLSGLRYWRNCYEEYGLSNKEFLKICLSAFRHII